MKQGSTNRKVNQQAREVIASILLFEISDPRLSLVTITGCEVSYDRSVCNVFYTADRGEYERSPKPSRRPRAASARLWRVSFPGAWRLRCDSSWINPWMRPSASRRRLSAMPSVIASLPAIAAEREAIEAAEEIDQESGEHRYDRKPSNELLARAACRCFASAR